MSIVLLDCRYPGYSFVNTISLTSGVATDIFGGDDAMVADVFFSLHDNNNVMQMTVVTTTE